MKECYFCGRPVDSDEETTIPPLCYTCKDLIAQVVRQMPTERR